MKKKRRKLAERIARKLFTNGQGERAVALRLFDDSSMYLGGWCESAVAAQIEKILKADSKKKASPR